MCPGTPGRPSDGERTWRPADLAGPGDLWSSTSPGGSSRATTPPPPTWTVWWAGCWTGSRATPWWSCSPTTGQDRVDNYGDDDDDDDDVDDYDDYDDDVVVLLITMMMMVMFLI